MVEYYGSFRAKGNAIYHLDNALTDASGNGNTMSNSSSAPTLTAGRYYYYNASFDGGDSYGATASASWGPADFSIGFWCYPTDHPDAGCIFGNFGSSGATTYGFTARYNDSQYFQLYIADGNYNEGTAGTTTSTYATNTWWHVVMTYKRSTTTGYIYVNGKLDMSKTNYPSMSYSTTNNYPRIGCRNIAGGNDRFFVGNLDDLWMTDYVISAQDVKRLYATAIGKYQE